jgi:hypothetical protein
VPSKPITSGLADQKLDCVSACLVVLRIPALQAWPQCDLLVQYGVWRDSITAVVQIEPPAPEAGDALGTFALSVMPPGPESSVCFPRDIIFVFDRSGSMTGGHEALGPQSQHNCSAACLVPLPNIQTKPCPTGKVAVAFETV